MIDSVLKGTGNSRFLKSAVPAGTSWADALAMLQAGTFPIDFNGINTEGFQQVGTPLNKANLLKDATAAQIGLPPSTTPDGMFQALGNTGELHVWRKTVTTAQEIPAGYTLDTQKTTQIYTATSNVAIFVSTASSIKINDSGGVELVNPNENRASGTFSDYVNILRGNFVQFSVPYTDSNKTTLYATGTYFVPKNANVTGSLQNMSAVMQEVKSYPLTPAGTTTTYPVSTNPKAYQEGDDAKEAGYVVGEVVTGSFYMGIPRNSYQNTYTYSSSLSVSDDGTVSLANPSTATSSQWSPLSTDVINSTLVGKFVQWTCQDPNNLDTKYPFNASPSPIIFIPSDAKITVTTPDSNERFTLSKYQPVTGYAAIPAGTTIEYLGKLGDKARVQVVSYVGTGTYGEDNPTVINFDFPPKVFLIGTTASSNGYGNAAVAGCGWISTTRFEGTSAQPYKIGFEGKKVSIYSSYGSYYGSPLTAYNQTGWTYIAVALG